MPLLEVLSLPLTEGRRNGGRPRGMGRMGARSGCWVRSQLAIWKELRKATYVCSVKLKVGGQPRNVGKEARVIAYRWDLGGGRNKSGNWWAAPSHFGKGYSAIYFNGEVSLEEVESWQREFGERLDLRRKGPVASVGTHDRGYRANPGPPDSPRSLTT